MTRHRFDQFGPEAPLPRGVILGAVVLTGVVSFAAGSWLGWISHAFF